MNTHVSGRVYLSLLISVNIYHIILYIDCLYFRIIHSAEFKEEYTTFNS